MDWALVGNILLITVLGGLGVAGILAVLIWKKNLATRITYIRLVIQAVAFGAMFYFFTFTIPLLYVLITIFAVTIVFGRFFCGWLCPFGLVMDLTIIVRKVTKIRYRILPDRLNKILHKSRYVILLFFLFVPIALWLISPPPSMTVAAMETPLLAGPFRPYSILIDPMIPFVVPWTSSTVSVFQINFTFPYAQEFITYTGKNIGQVIAIAFIGVTMVGSFFIRRFWCRFCPTAASLGVMNRFKGFNWAPACILKKTRKNAQNVEFAREFVNHK